MKLKRLRKVVFEPLTHTYLMGDTALKGVTTLMREQGLSPDYSGIPEAVLAKAAEKGTAIHEALEDYDNGKPIILPEEAKDYPKLGLNVICSEYLVSDCKSIATKIDKVIYVDENTVDLADVKTTSTLHKDAVSWQLSLCKYLFNLVNPGIKVRDFYAIHIRNGKCKYVLIDQKPEEAVLNVVKCNEDGEVYGGSDGASASVEDSALILTDEEQDRLVQCTLKMADLKQTIKQLEEVASEITEKMVVYMKEHHLTEMNLPGGVAKLRDEYIRESIDSKALKADHPDLAEQYTKQTVVKASITIKTK